MTPSTAEGRRPKVLVILGTRPEAIKMASTVAALRRRDLVDSLTVFTGQHAELMTSTARTLGLMPDLQIVPLTRGRSLPYLLGHLIQALGKILSEYRPDVVVVQGDTISALAGALAAELAPSALLHVEAGVRSPVRDDPFPEETSRRLISSISEMHLCFTHTAIQALLDEGVPSDHMALVPHPLRERVLMSGVESTTKNKIALVTLHRRERRMQRFSSLLAIIDSTQSTGEVYKWQFIWHPGLDGASEARRALETLHVEVLEPMPPDAFIQLLATASLVITDSAGVSEEAQLLGKPLLILREFAEPRVDGSASGPFKATEDVSDALDFVRTHVSQQAMSTDPPRSAEPTSMPHGRDRPGTMIASYIEQFAGRVANGRVTPNG